MGESELGGAEEIEVLCAVDRTMLSVVTIFAVLGLVEEGVEIGRVTSVRE